MHTLYSILNPTCTSNKIVYNCNMRETKNKFMYKSFNKYLLRTPTFSYETLDDISIKKLMLLIKDPYISEAIYISSPEFHTEMMKCINGQIDFSERMFNTILKFILRICTRCTPFGIFSGVSVGEKSTNSKVSVQDISEYSRVSKFDMDFLYSLSQQFCDNPIVRSNLRYYPNNSLYVIGDSLRYVESRYDNDIKKNLMSSIDNSFYVEEVLSQARRGKSIKELAQSITDEEITDENAVEFVNNLIDEQIIVSSIYPNVTGEDYFSILKAELTPVVKGLFTDIETLLKNINLNNSNGSDFKLNYIELHKLLRKNNIAFKEKLLIQTDLIVKCTKNELSEAVFSDVDKALRILNKLSNYDESQNLKKFKEEFYRRYEDAEMPLSIVLDVESGIGFPPLINEIYELSPLVDDLYARKKTEDTTGLTKKDHLLNSKILDCIKNNSNEIIITDLDLINFEENWDNLPATFSVFINILNSKNRIKISDVGNVTATAILGRFAQADKNIKKFVNEIIQKEDALLNDNEIICEISHLPEKSFGNILSRPCLRQYEIPYLSKSYFSEENQILIDDIYISIKEDKILLKSRKNNKIIIPRLATAHNFTEDNLPIYLFLCEMQSQGINDFLTFDWGNIFKLHSFFPRVLYANTVLSPCMWVLSTNIIEKIKSEKDVQEWRNSFDVPDKIFLKDLDVELFIDFNNEMMTKLFIAEIKNKSRVMIVEYMFDDNSALVTNINRAKYTNEIVISYYKNLHNEK